MGSLCRKYDSTQQTIRHTIELYIDFTLALAFPLSIMLQCVGTLPKTVAAGAKARRKNATEG